MSEARILTICLVKNAYVPIDDGRRCTACGELVEDPVKGNERHKSTFTAKEAEAFGILSHPGALKRRGGVFDGRIVISNLEGREAELDALMDRFGVTAYQRIVSEERLPDYKLLCDRLDFFLAQLRQAGFEFEERPVREEGE